MSKHVDAERLAQLRAVPLFSSLSNREIARVDQLVDDVHVEAGEVLMREGRRGVETFVILRGHARVSIENETIAELGPGEIFGEMSVLGSVNARTATVTSATPMHLLVVVPQNLVTLLELPGVAAELIRTLINRLRTRVSARSA